MDKMDNPYLSNPYLDYEIPDARLRQLLVNGLDERELAERFGRDTGAVLCLPGPGNGRGEKASQSSEHLHIAKIRNYPYL